MKVTEPHLGPTVAVFRHDDGTVWTSHFYRTSHLLPLLHLQRMEGDPL